MTKEAQSPKWRKNEIIIVRHLIIRHFFELRHPDFVIVSHIAFNIATRRSCRPPSKPVSSQIRTISSARSSGIRRWPMESTLRHCVAVKDAPDSSLQQSAQRTP